MYSENDIDTLELLEAKCLTLIDSESFSDDINITVKSKDANFLTNSGNNEEVNTLCKTNTCEPYNNSKTNKKRKHLKNVGLLELNNFVYKNIENTQICNTNIQVVNNKSNSNNNNVLDKSNNNLKIYEDKTYNKTEKMPINKINGLSHIATLPKIKGVNQKPTSLSKISYNSFDDLSQLKKVLNNYSKTSAKKAAISNDSTALQIQLLKKTMRKSPPTKSPPIPLLQNKIQKINYKVHLSQLIKMLSFYDKMKRRSAKECSDIDFTKIPVVIVPTTHYIELTRLKPTNIFRVPYSLSKYIAESNSSNVVKTKNKLPSHPLTRENLSLKKTEIVPLSSSVSSIGLELVQRFVNNQVIQTEPNMADITSEANNTLGLKHNETNINTAFNTVFKKCVCGYNYHNIWVLEEHFKTVISHFYGIISCCQCKANKRSHLFMEEKFPNHLLLEHQLEYKPEIKNLYFCENCPQVGLQKFRNRHDKFCLQFFKNNNTILAPISSSFDSFEKQNISEKTLITIVKRAKLNDSFLNAAQSVASSAASKISSPMTSQSLKNLDSILNSVDLSKNKHAKSFNADACVMNNKNKANDMLWKSPLTNVRLSYQIPLIPHVPTVPLVPQVPQIGSNMIWSPDATNNVFPTQYPIYAPIVIQPDDVDDIEERIADKNHSIIDLTSPLVKTSIRLISNPPKHSNYLLTKSPVPLSRQMQSTFKKQSQNLYFPPHAIKPIPILPKSSCPPALAEQKLRPTQPTSLAGQSQCVPTPNYINLEGNYARHPHYVGKLPQFPPTSFTPGRISASVLKEKQSNFKNAAVDKYKANQTVSSLLRTKSANRVSGANEKLDSQLSDTISIKSGNTRIILPVVAVVDHKVVVGKGENEDKVTYVKKLHCKICKTKFRLKEKLDQHILKKHIHMCNRCNSKWPNKESLREHCNIVHQNEQDACTVCGEKVRIGVPMTRHLHRRHTKICKVYLQPMPKSLAMKYLKKLDSDKDFASLRLANNMDVLNTEDNPMEMCLSVDTGKKRKMSCRPRIKRSYPKLSSKISKNIDSDASDTPSSGITKEEKLKTSLECDISKPENESLIHSVNGSSPLSINADNSQIHLNDNLVSYASNGTRRKKVKKLKSKDELLTPLSPINCNADNLSNLNSNLTESASNNFYLNPLIHTKKVVKIKKNKTKVFETIIIDNDNNDDNPDRSNPISYDQTSSMDKGFVVADSDTGLRNESSKKKIYKAKCIKLTPLQFHDMHEENDDCSNDEDIIEL